jgi:hypothetical protein
VVIITADASDESKSSIQKEREFVVERETTKQHSAPKPPEQPSVLENEAVIAEDATEENKYPIQNDHESVGERKTAK